MLSQFSATEITLVIVLLVIELGLLIAAWAILFRTPSDRLTLPKWAWALLCLVQLVGPIAFFAVGRRSPQVADFAHQPDSTTATTSRVVDDLYGDR
ncbi:MAG: PLDc N-terminal domain-containing protein [Actinobacteria bacterium]|nr:PLDc N-terminal domain-containing protein [Actinomycetota bacterium]